jgi:WD40 repeat protein/tetratricopeptide (TPR) repeat protein
VREIGRGGMGVVYEALQQSLGRHVALKVLPSHVLAGSSQLERFRLEARAAGRLHHTNIVPVFGVGESEGLHYYAMQFIQGQGLDVVVSALRGLRDDTGPVVAAVKNDASVTAGDDRPLTAVLTQALLAGRFAAPQPAPRPEPTAASAEALTSPPSQGLAGLAPGGRANGLPTTDAGRSSELSSGQAGAPYYRSVARVGVQVADALAHAHGQGILHRDIKPSNLLLDSKGNVWVTDFGLAKAEGSDGLTQTGDIVGTLRYMAPERFDGWSDPRSDVYSLGATLYELLTLRPPFPEPDRAKLIEQVMHEEPTPPQKLDRRIPRDLETIVLKALAKEPGQRYTTSEQMAEDLRRFGADRPILARRISTAERAWRWCKRNPLLAGAAGAVAAALVAVAVISLIYAKKISGLATDLAEDRQSLRKSLSQSNRLLAIRNFERGQAACEKGEIGPGMLWMIESWRSAVAAGDPVWQHAARANLAAWRPHYPRLRMVLSHPMPVLHAAFSPDGRTVISGSMDGTAQLWDAASGQRIGSPLQQGGEWIDVGFSPDGKIALTSSDGKPGRLWDAVTGQPIGPTLTHPIHVYPLAFSPDGRMVITPRADGTAQLCDGATGQPIGSPLKHQGGFRCAAFSPDGRIVLTVSDDGTVLFWDAVTGEPVGLPLKRPGGFTSAGFSPDGKTVLTVSRDGAAQLWDTATRQPIGLPLNRPGGFRDALFSPDSKTILTTGSTGRRDATAQLWDAVTGQPIGPPMRHESEVRAVAFSPDGNTVLTGGQGKEARLWDAATGQLIGLLEHQGGISRVAFSPDGKTILTGSLDRTVRLWDAGPQKPVAQVPDIPSNATTRQPSARLPYPGGTRSAAFGLDGKVRVTISADKTVRLWDRTTGAALGTPFPLPGPPLATKDPLCFCPDGTTFLFVSEDQRVWLCDAATGSVRGRTAALGGDPYGLGFSPDGKTFFTGLDNGEVRLWDAATVTPLGDPIPNPAGAISAGLFSHDGKSLLVACEDGSVRLWDVATRKQLIPPLRHQGPVSSLAFSPDGKTITTGSASQSTDKTTRLWDVATGYPIGPVLRHTDDVPVAPGLPDELDRMAAWVEVITGLRLDEQQGLVEVLDNGTWLQRRDRLMQLGGPPETGPDQRLDPILFGPDPTARARSLMGRKQWDAAEAAFDEAMRARPSNMAIVLARGDLYTKRALWSEAAAYYANKAKQYPDVELLHYRHVLSLLSLGDEAGLRRACSDLLDRFGSSTGSLDPNNLAWCCVLAPLAVADREAPVRLAESAVNDAPAAAKPTYLNTLGAALYRAGRSQEAISRLEEGIRKRAGKGFPQDWVFLAMAHHQLGHDVEAHSWLDRLRSYRPNESDGAYWNELEIRLLRREAEATILCDPIFPVDPFAPE